eukprot:2746780-Ditylum_brightwellii.AAC.1
MLVHPYFCTGIRSGNDLGLGLGLGLDTVFILGPKPSIRSGSILGSWFGTRSWSGHGFLSRVWNQAFDWVRFLVWDTVLVLDTVLHQVQHKKLDWDLILAWDTFLVRTKVYFGFKTRNSSGTQP